MDISLKKMLWCKKCCVHLYIKKNCQKNVSSKNRIQKNFGSKRSGEKNLSPKVFNIFDIFKNFWKLKNFGSKKFLVPIKF